MTKLIDSQALGILQKSLGVTGRGSQLTELADGVVDQALSVGEIVRRGRTLGVTGGMFSPTIRNIHTDAESISTSIDPYAPGTTFAVPPYPPIVNDQFDVWLLGASVRVVSGSGTFSGTLSISIGTTRQGWGVDSAGARPLVSQAIRLAYWDAIVSDGTSFVLRNGSRGPHAKIGLRIPRGGTLLLFRTTSSLTSSYDCQLILGMFPVALGQDGIT